MKLIKEIILEYIPEPKKKKKKVVKIGERLVQRKLTPKNGCVLKQVLFQHLDHLLITKKQEV